VGTTSRPPKWIKPQLTRLVDEAPAGGGWLPEIKYDGYRRHARIDGRELLTDRPRLVAPPRPPFLLVAMPYRARWASAEALSPQIREIE
jgi:hypothetical protein